MTTRKPYSLAILIKYRHVFSRADIAALTTNFSSNVGKLATLPRTPKTMTPLRLTDLMAVFMTCQTVQRQLHCQEGLPPHVSDSLRIALRFLGRERHYQDQPFLTSRYAFLLLQ